MAQPTWLSDGTTPRRTDTRRIITAKWLGALQNMLGTTFAANDPHPHDTWRVLLEKIDCAKSGVAYHG